MKLNGRRLTLWLVKLCCVDLQSFNWGEMIVHRRGEDDDEEEREDGICLTERVVVITGEKTER
jgi:hypothetical protein